jgi:hypothetical protein
MHLYLPFHLRIFLFIFSFLIKFFHHFDINFDYFGFFFYINFDQFLLLYHFSIIFYTHLFRHSTILIFTLLQFLLYIDSCLIISLSKLTLLTYLPPIHTPVLLFPCGHTFYKLRDLYIYIYMYTCISHLTKRMARFLTLLLIIYLMIFDIV